MNKSTYLTLLTGIAMLLAIPAQAFGNVQDIAFSISSQSAQGMDIQFVLPDYQITPQTVAGTVYDQIMLSDAGSLTEIGMPKLPTLSTMIAIPCRGKAYVEVISASTRAVEHILPYPSQREEATGRNWELNPAVYEGNQVYPLEVLHYSEPQIMRDFRLITVQVQPFAWDAATHRLLVRDRITLRVRFTDEPGSNELAAPPRNISASFDKIYSSLILNYRDFRTGLIANTPAKIVIIYGAYADATFQQKLANYVLWKRQKGAEVSLISTAVTGVSSTEIKEYLQNLYNDPATRPDFVTILGDVTGSFAVPTWNSYGMGDYPYQMLAGNDQLGDIFIGRISAENTSQLDVILSKIYAYEKTLNVPAAQWLNRMLLTADTQQDGVSVVYLSNYIRELSLRQNPDYTYTMLCSVSPSPSSMNAALSQGVGFFNYRGYAGMSGWTVNEANLNNVNKVCHAVIITCNTGNFDATGTTEQFIRVGTAAAPKGAVTAIGMWSSGTATMPNNALSGGIFSGIFTEGMRTMGEALLHSKLNFARLFQISNPTMYLSFSQWCNLMGDPTMEVYTGIPDTFNSTAPTSIPYGTNNLDITVTDQTGLPVPDACVTISGTIGTEPGIMSRGYTDAAGLVYLPFTALTAGAVTMTISKHDCKPLQQVITVNTGSLVAGLTLIDDDTSGNSSGNGNSIANAGETLEVRFSLRNTTADAINTVTGYATCSSPAATVVDSLVSFGNLAVGATQFNTLPVLFRIAPQTPNNTLLRFTLHLNDAAATTYNVMDFISVTAAELRFVSSQLDDSANNVLDPGETAFLNITVLNNGTLPLSNLLGELFCDNDLVSVTDSLGTFGTVNVNSTATTGTNNYVLTGRNTLLPGMIIPFRLRLSNPEGFLQWVSFQLSVGAVTMHDPLGPDAYGYVIYDDTDVSYPDCPVYDWIGIAPLEGGAGTALSINDPEAMGEGDGSGAASLAAVTLPFAFTFYGQSYSLITVCSNGFIVMGSTQNAEFRNYRLPGAMGPSPMIAPFWDDLATGGDSGIYTWFDAANHTFVIEWYHMLNGYLNTQQETFQVILYDPAYYPSGLGDGAVKIQYQDFNNVDSGASNQNHGNYCTIGIENADQSDGLEYSFSNTYPTAASPLGNGRALYLTNVPVYHANAWLTMECTIINDALANSVQPGESVQLGVQLLNIGNNPAADISAVLSSADPYVTITNASSDYYPIAANSSGVNRQGFTFTVAPDCPGDHVLAFNLQINTPDHIWTPAFNISVLKSELSYESFFLNDVDGNNNGSANPDEDFLLIINVINRSDVEALNLVGMVTTPDTHTTIANPVVNLLQAGRNEMVQFVYNIHFDADILPNTYVPFNFTCTAENTAPITSISTVGCGNIGINSDFESTDSGFVSPAGWAWGVPAQTTAHSGTKVWATGLTGQYPNGANFSLTSQPVIIGSNATLSFWHQLGCQGSYDGGNVSVSTNGGASWTVVSPASGGTYINTVYSMNEPGFSGTIGTWAYVTFNLAAWSNSVILLRWHFTSDGSITGLGWFIDDVMVTGYAIRAGVISGEVSLSDSGNPASAKVSTAFTDVTVSALPDTSGIYGLYLPVGTYTLTATLPYYESASSPQMVISDQNLVYTQDFVLNSLPAVTELTLTCELGSPTVTLSWLAPVNPVYPVLSYIIYRKLGPGIFTEASEVTGTLYSEDLNLAGHYYYYVSPVYSAGEGAPSTQVEIAFPHVPVVADPTAMPVNALLPNFPNPFNPSTTLSYSTARSGRVSLKIYNTKGQLVRNLVSSPQSAGRHSIVWDGRDEDGKTTSTGLYFYRLISGNYTATHKMLMLK